MVDRAVKMVDRAVKRSASRRARVSGIARTPRAGADWP